MLVLIRKKQAGKNKTEPNESKQIRADSVHTNLGSNPQNLSVMMVVMDRKRVNQWHFESMQLS